MWDCQSSEYQDFPVQTTRVDDRVPQLATPQTLSPTLRPERGGLECVLSSLKIEGSFIKFSDYRDNPTQAIVTETKGKRF